MHWKLPASCWEVWTVPLTEFQQEFLRNCSHRWNVKTGATRSGKTYLDCAVTIPKRICAARDEGLCVMLGNTLGTLERNVLEPMRALWGPELVGVVRTSASGNIVQLFGRKVYVLGADNKKHIARIQGAAFEYAYGDEITTWDEGVFQMLKSRLSCPHSHFDGTCNPDNPQHWFKQFLDSDADIYCQAYTIDDNPTLPPEFVAQLKKEYAGTVYYNRFILGQWAAAGGIIYRPFADSIAAGDGRFLWPAANPCHPWRIHIGVDFGGNGSRHAFVATGILPYYAGVVGLASARIDPKDQDADYLAAQLIDFCTAVFARYGEIHYLFCDSAEQTLINHIRTRLRASRLSWLADRVNNSAKIQIIDRIRLTSILMGGGRFWYMPEAATLRDALASALWSQKHPGVDERLEIARKVAPNVKRLIVRIQPYMHEVYGEVYENLEKFKAAGAYGVIVEGMKFASKRPGLVKVAGDYTYPKALIESDILKLKQRAHELGLALYSGENRTRELGDSLCCCGVSDLPGFKVNEYNLNHLLHGGKPAKTPQMQKTGTAMCFQSLYQNTANSRRLRGESFESEMLNVYKTKRDYVNETFGLK